MRVSPDLTRNMKPLKWQPIEIYADFSLISGLITFGFSEKLSWGCLEPIPNTIPNSLTVTQGKNREEAVSEQVSILFKYSTLVIRR
jgi:hypothetical protein